MTTDETWHEVYLCQSGTTTIFRIDETATVTCYVNDTLAATADSVRYDDLFQVHAFKAVFHEQDRIRIEATFKEHHVSSEFLVPDAPVIMVDTVARKDIYDRTYYQCSMSVLDASKGDSFYILFNNSARIEVRQTREGSVIEYGEGSNLYKYAQDDPVLELINEDFFSQLSDEELDGHVVYGGFPLFRDISFPGGSYSFTGNYYLKHGLVMIDGGISDGWWLRCTIIFSIGAVSEEFYQELKRNNGSGDDILSEPYLNRDNVTGGTGYCGIINKSCLEITFPDFQYF